MSNSRLTESLTNAAAWDFTQRFLRPAATRARVAETISFEGDYVTRTDTIEFQREDSYSGASPLPQGAEPARRYLPVLRFNKDHLVDNFWVKDSSQTSISTLQYGEFMVLSGLCIRALLAASVDLESFKGDPTKKREYDRVELALLALVVNSPNPEERDVEPLAKRLRANLKRRFDITSEDDATLLCSFVAQLSVCYAIVLEVNVVNDARLLYQCGYTEPLRTQSHNFTASVTRGSRLKGIFRDALGLSPATINLDVARAKKTASYHLRLEAPKGYYIGELWFYDRSKPRETATIERTEPTSLYDESRPYFRCPSPRGRSSGHLYTRSFDRATDVGRPWLQVRFFEKLPGSLGKSWVFATSVLVVTWVSGVSLHQGSASDSGQPFGGINPGTLIFALPLALWAITGLSEGVRPYSATLVSSISTGCSLVLAISTLLSTLFIAARRISPALQWPSVALVTHPLWIILLALATINAMGITEVLLVRYWRWRRLLGAARGPMEITPDA